MYLSEKKGRDSRDFCKLYKFCLIFYMQQFWQPGLQPGTSQDVKPFPQPAYTGKPATAVSSGDMVQAPPPPPWEGRAIATHKLRLVEFSAFMEQQREPDTVSIHITLFIQ